MEHEVDEGRLSRPNFHSWIKSLTTLVGAGQGWEKKKSRNSDRIRTPDLRPAIQGDNYSTETPLGTTSLAVFIVNNFPPANRVLCCQ